MGSETFTPQARLCPNQLRADMGADSSRCRMGMIVGLAHGVRGLFEFAGFEVREDEPGIYRAYEDGRIRGLCVVKENRVTYAEHAGRVFAWWDSNYAGRYNDFSNHVRNNPAGRNE
jgi:hypothetical protein